MTHMHDQPHESAVAAQINAPAEVTLYDERGAEVRVDAAQADYWLARGFSTRRLDPPSAHVAFAVTLDAAKSAVAEYVASATQDGVIDHSDEGARAAAHVAMQEMEQAWGELQRAVDASFPKREASPVVMQQADGRTIQVDPAQVEHYRAQGFEVSA